MRSSVETGRGLRGYPGATVATDDLDSTPLESVVQAVAVGASRYLDRRAGTWGVLHTVGGAEYEERYTVPNLDRQIPAALHHPSSAIRAEFDEYSAAWRQKTATMSQLTDMVMLDEYQRIIGMGRPAIPLIIEALRAEVDHWFWALKAIAGEDHAAGASTMSEAATLWISWYDSLSVDG